MDADVVVVIGMEPAVRSFQGKVGGPREMGGSLPLIDYGVIKTLNSCLVTVEIITLEQFKLKYILMGTNVYIGLVHAMSLKQSEV